MGHRAEGDSHITACEDCGYRCRSSFIDDNTPSLDLQLPAFSFQKRGIRLLGDGGDDGVYLNGELRALDGNGTASAQMLWVAAGLAFAAWVKLGGWPFHIWSQSGERLSLASHAWLFATLVPALGAYLLYRVTPLLALSGPVRVVSLWIGAGSAAIAALLALNRPSPRSSLPFVGAVQSGLVLLTAASGRAPAVWLSILALTPVRLLLFLAADTAQQSRAAGWRRVSASLFALGGVALVAFSLLAIWWARAAGAPAPRRRGQGRVRLSRSS